MPRRLGVILRVLALSKSYLIFMAKFRDGSPGSFPDFRFLPAPHLGKDPAGISLSDAKDEWER